MEGGSDFKIGKISDSLRIDTTIARTNDRASAPVTLQKTTSSDPVSLQLDSRRDDGTSDVRSQFNSIINATNVTQQAISEIERITKSISGIVEQAADPNVPQQRLPVLEKEAAGLRDRLLRTSRTEALDGVRPLEGDPIRFEAERQLGKTLEIVLPKDAAEAFGIPEFSFDSREAILNTIVSVRTATVRLQKLREALSDGQGQLQKAAVELDVAHQNTEASQVSVRDLDDALKLAGETGYEIRGNPEGALGSVKNLDPRALKLLES